MTLAPGSRLGAYEILERIAAGGMGEVFKARQDRLQRMVAIKVLRGGAMGNDEVRQRFRREIELLSRLSHPHLIRLLDGGHEDGQPYLVMELVEGRTLAAERPAHPRPIVDFLRLALPIAEAIDHLHAQGVLHRDLKPSNVLVDRDGRPRVSDFGLARSADATVVTEADQVLGTPAYMPPEVLQGLAWTAAGDVYSLGVIFYEMLTNLLPYAPEPGPLDYLAQVQSGNVIPITSRRRAAPTPLDGLITRMLARDPARRPSAAEVLRTLAEVEPPVVEPTDDRVTVAWVKPGAAKPERAAPLPAAPLLAAAVGVPLALALLVRAGGEASRGALPATPPATPEVASAAPPTAGMAVDPTTWLRHYNGVISSLDHISRGRSSATVNVLIGGPEDARWASERKNAIREVRALVRAADESGLPGPVWSILSFECTRLFEHLNRRNLYDGLGDPSEAPGLLRDLRPPDGADPHRICFARFLEPFCEKSRHQVDEARHQGFLRIRDLLEIEISRPGNEVADRFLMFFVLHELRESPGLDDAIRRMMQTNPARDSRGDAVTRRYLGLAMQTLPRLLEYDPVPAWSPAWDSIVRLVSDETGNILEDFANDRTEESADIVLDALKVLDGCFFYADRMGTAHFTDLMSEIRPLVRETAVRMRFDFRHIAKVEPAR